jgi:hypothetical protein
VAFIATLASISETVVDLVAGSGLGFTDQGLRVLEGVAGSWRLFSADARVPSVSP